MKEARLWLLHLIAGAVLIIFLGGHMLVMHLAGLLAKLGAASPEPLAYSAVAERSQSPAWQIFYIIFLIPALYHGFYGLRGILLEVFGAKEKGNQALTVVLSIAGILAFFFAAYVVLAS